MLNFPEMHFNLRSPIVHFLPDYVSKHSEAHSYVVYFQSHRECVCAWIVNLNYCQVCWVSKVSRSIPKCFWLGSVLLTGVSLAGSIVLMPEIKYNVVVATDVGPSVEYPVFDYCSIYVIYAWSNGWLWWTVWGVWRLEHIPDYRWFCASCRALSGVSRVQFKVALSQWSSGWWCWWSCYCQYKRAALR